MEFASYEDAQRAIRELSEVPLLGRPVFIREVCSNHLSRSLGSNMLYKDRENEARFGSTGGKRDLNPI